MGKSSGSDSDRGRKKRRRRQNSRSRSPASSSSRSPSRSRTVSKYQSSRHRSKRDSRSRSPDRSRRSRRSRSRSKERSFKSYSSKGSGSSRSYSSKSRRSNRSRSRSRSRSRDRKESREIKREKDEKTLHKKTQDTSSKKLSSPPHPILDKTQNADDQLKAKLQMALKAAADADALLREQGVLTGGGAKDWGRFGEEKEKSPPKEKPPPAAPPMLISEQLERAKALDSINAPGFCQQSFVSGKVNPVVLEEKQSMNTHDAAIFGTEAEEKTAVKEPSTEPVVAPVDKDSAAHENLFVDIPLKEERWIKKLMYMRQRKLNGEAMF